MHDVHHARASRLTGSSREAQLDLAGLTQASIDEDLEQERANSFERSSSVVGQFFQVGGLSLQDGAKVHEQGRLKEVEHSEAVILTKF